VFIFRYFDNSSTASCIRIPFKKVGIKRLQSQFLFGDDQLLPT